MYVGKKINIKYKKILFLFFCVSTILSTPLVALAGSCLCSGKYERNGQIIQINNVCKTERVVLSEEDSGQSPTAQGHCNLIASYYDGELSSGVNCTYSDTSNCSSLNQNNGEEPDNIFGNKTAGRELLGIAQQIKPTPAIRIPGLHYSTVVTSTAVGPDGVERDYRYIPWVGQFLAVIYKFGLIICSLVAVALVIKKGFDIIISGGENTAEHYKRIGQIFIGLLLMWGSYAIMYNINPALVEFKALRLEVVIRDELPDRASGSSNTNDRPDEVQNSYARGKGAVDNADRTACPSLAPGTIFKGAFTTYWNIGKSNYGKPGKYKGSYHGPADPSLQGMEDFFCGVSMECGCPNGKGAKACGKSNWAVCKYFPKDARWCEPKDYIPGGSIAASTCFPYNCKLETNKHILVVKDRGAGIIGTHFDLYLGVDDQPNFTKDTSWLDPDNIKVIDCSQEMKPAFRTKWQGYYNKAGYGKPGVCKPGINC